MTVTVTGVMLETGGAVNRPEALMLPALADHVTAGLKGPVSDTVAEQVLVWPEATIEGAQVTLTEVMPEGFPPSPLSPPPQAAIRSALPMTKTDRRVGTGPGYRRTGPSVGRRPALGGEDGGRGNPALASQSGA